MKHLILLLLTLLTSLEMSAWSYPMTNHTKALYEDIVANYNWLSYDTMLKEDMQKFSDAMEKAMADNLNDSTGHRLSTEACLLKAMQNQDFPRKDIDEYWEREKIHIENVYSEGMKSLNFLQKKYLFGNLKKVWRENCDLYIYNLALQACQKHNTDRKQQIEAAQQKNDKKKKDNLKLKGNAYFIEDEINTLTTNIEKQKKTNSSVSTDVSKLKERQRQILDENRSYSR